jgi:regulator of sigma E protease
MHTLLTIIAFLFIFSLLILIHECGHFFVAKWKGIKIEEFGFGLPPRIWGKKYGETLYSLNWIPFGGFVRMLGEDARDKKAMKSARSFMRKSKWDRTQVICAGVLMNFLLAWVLFSAGFMVGMQPLIVNGDDFLNGVRQGDIMLERVDVDVAVVSEELSVGRFDIPRVVVAEGAGFQEGDTLLTVDGSEVFFVDELAEKFELASSVEVEFLREGEIEIGIIDGAIWDELKKSHPIISGVVAGSPAETAGIEVRDRVVAVNSEEVVSPEEIVSIVTSSDDSLVTYDVLRDGVLLSFEMEKNESGLIGVVLSGTHSDGGFILYEGSVPYIVADIADIKYPVYEAPWRALVEMKRISGFTMVMIGKLFGNIFTTGSVPQEVAGPVGIAQMTGVYVQEGFVALMRFTGLLSLSLAVINIFPFPALDGGRQLFVIIEAIRGKPLDTRIEGYIHGVGFVFLILVILMVTFQDIGRLFT